MASTVRGVVNQQILRGRSDETGRLLETMRYTLRGNRGAVAVVTGSAGLGKSALISAASQRAAQLGFAVGCGLADPADADYPLALLFAAMRSGTVPLLSTETMRGLARKDDSGLWLLDALAEALAERAAEGPVLLALDNVDRADKLSRLALRQLPGRLVEMPVVWLLAGRSLPSGIGELGSADSGGAGLHIELEPLGGQAIEQLAADRLNHAPGERLRTALRSAQGNPRLAVALIAEPEDPFGLGEACTSVGTDHDRERALPERLVVDVRAMLAPLPPATLSLLRAGAVLGSSFTAKGAACLLGQTVEAAVLPVVESLVREGLLTDDGNSLTFRHELVRRAVYADVPPTVRRAMHRAAARHPSATADGLAEAAGHLIVGADPGDAYAVELLQRAAAATADSHPARAAQFAVAAFRLLGTADPAQRTAVGGCAVRMLARAGQAAEAVALAEKVSAAQGASPLDHGPALEESESGVGACNSAAALRLEADLIEPLWQLGRLDELRIRAERRLVDPTLPQAVRPLMLAQLALGTIHAPTQAVGRAAAAAALLSAPYQDMPPARPLALLALGELDRAAGCHAAALARFSARRRSVGLRGAVDEISTLFELDRFADAAALIERVEAAAGTRPEWGLRPVVAWARMRHSFASGDFDAAHSAALAVFGVDSDGPVNAWYVAEARLVRIELALLCGDPATARVALREAQDIAMPPVGDDGSWAVRLALFEGRIEGEEGAAVEAATLIRKAVAGAVGTRLRWSADWTAEAARLAVHGGDLPLAARISSMADETAARNPGVPSVQGASLLIRGMIAADTAVLSEAVEVLRRGPRRVMLAQALADCGAALLDAGARSRGVTMLDEAGALFRTTGAAGGLQRAQSRLRTAGVRRRWAAAPTRPEHGWAALTEAEQRVAQRVADGLSNKAVAADLHLSVNTVSTHLRAVFTKLGVRSRAQLIRVALTSSANAEGTAGNDALRVVAR